MFAENELLAVDGQRRLGDFSINWIWSHHQFETELFILCTTIDRVNVIFRGRRSSKCPADSGVGPGPIRARARDQFFEAG